MGAKKVGLRAAIDAFCKSCIFDPRGGGGSWRQQVEACTAPECPLYPVRPVSSGKGPSGGHTRPRIDDLPESDPGVGQERNAPTGRETAPDGEAGS